MQIAEISRTGIVAPVTDPNQQKRVHIVEKGPEETSETINHTNTIIQHAQFFTLQI